MRLLIFGSMAIIQQVLPTKDRKKPPIIEELQAIEQSLASLKQVAVFIDDIRCFTPNSPYPTLDYLVNWANQHHLLWCIEYDIFVAKSHA